VTPSYSQEGEDRVLARLFEYQAVGTYVDIGAHHPRRFNNTFLLYQRGWSGLNVDPLPGTKARFDRARPRDINLECGVADQAGTLAFYEFAEPALSTFSSQVVSHRLAEGQRLRRELQIPVLPLIDVVAPLSGREIDLLTVDVEGLDNVVLSGSALAELRPRVVCFESHLGGLEQRGPVDEVLLSLGYVWFAATGLSRLYRIRD
jgi:FkbM family methyltransferase